MEIIPSVISLITTTTTTTQVAVQQYSLMQTFASVPTTNCSKDLNNGDKVMNCECCEGEFSHA
jgi:hypothetical protein